MKKLILLSLFCMIAAFSARSAVTFNVQVPPGTKKCYVCGDFNGWDAGNPLQLSPAGTNLFSLTAPDLTASDLSKGYKYLCGPDWTYVEKDASGNEISNRTQLGNPDIVGSWYNVPEWDIQSVEINVNGIPRLLKVYLPEGYDSSTEYFPVIYYNTVQQRYNDAGNDADPGDYFFGANSWNAHTTMEARRSQGGLPYIMVQICSMLSENTPEENAEYAGTGGATAYLDAFITELMPYVEKTWRVKTGALNTVITGADYGALFSLYAALERPDLFGTCVAMSPMLWINEGCFDSVPGAGRQGQSFLISAGSAEPGWMQQDAASLAAMLNDLPGATATFTLFPGAAHNDEDWGACFGNILQAIDTQQPPMPSVRLRNARKAFSDIPFGERTFTLYAGEDKNNLQKIGVFTYTDDYRKKGSDTPVEAFVNTNEIPVAFKSTYYWNIAMGPDPSYGWLLDNVKDIGFSSKKNTPSWQNVAIYADGTTSDIAAHSQGFKLVTPSEEIMMTSKDPFMAEAKASFPGKDKSFHINFGSVNSGSDMGAVTPTLNVSANCVEATILYDFNLNKVTVNETKFGASIDDLKVESLTAVPAVCMAGTDVKLSLTLNGAADVEISCRKDFSADANVSTVKTSDTTYAIELKNAQTGVYTFSVTLISGETRMPGAAEINVKVLSGTASEGLDLTVNPYGEIDWEKTGRYKANFHTHTSQSFDTQYTTTQVVDKYKGANYDILSLTDHDANSYPWSMFSLYNPFAADRDPEVMGMLAVPGVELSKDRRNNWSEKTGGEFNHHNDFFTGRKGQEFMSLRESYAYTLALGGMQIINHPGQYWNLSTEYKAGEKNSPEWHAENFQLYESLIGLEVYNQGNRRPNDRILWDRILSKTMPSRPVWGYSCDDTHTAEQYFRNYQYMLMPELSTEALKEAMRNGTTVFSYEYTGSGQALTPHVTSVKVDEETRTITIDTDDSDMIEWISSTHRTGSSASTMKSSVVGLGKTFDYTGFQGSYVRARLVNKYGETALQPFGFDVANGVTTAVPAIESPLEYTYDNSAKNLQLLCYEGIVRVSLVNTGGMVVKIAELSGDCQAAISTEDLPAGVYIAVVATPHAAYTAKFMNN